MSVVKEKKQMQFGKHRLDFNHKTYVMGILNATPDSFSDGGKYIDVGQAVERAKEMVAQGADIIDIGGESTRPGAEYVTEEEESLRVIPVIKAVRQSVDVPLSIDTYKSTVAEVAVKHGVDIINDVWGAKYDPKIAEVAAKYDVPIILTHNREKASYENVSLDLISDLKESIEICHQAGVKDEQIILDPGIGFAKDYEQNLQAMRGLSQLAAQGYPILLGTSRKSLIAKTLDLPPEDRVEGTGATVCYGIREGCDIVRVHDVLEMKRMTKMMDVLLGKGASHG
ncbi:dihydropteroate synthase [Texcoconibacillus texcoconensis]|uniref:Dihydropteroate synthase n=1 Tax=Texcoconibacillus texcoconensis TaxID=1095777 RepID=A0A840QUC4_9BACI|nr:dihydropteroate synthase [Texcoconibacillus texcoconensis]MBB5174881.1 dihydropteroate synthase [Texcoconibacillus texcoconensis]